MVKSNDYPEIIKLQGNIITPYCINEVEIEDEAGTRTEYQYLEHRAPDTGQRLPGVEEQRAIVYEACETDLHSHVFSRYPVSSQTSILAHFMRAQMAGRNDIIEACEAVQDWCSSCVSYFRSLIAATYSQDPLTVSWDFSDNCPIPDGMLSLSDIETMWQQ